MSLSACERDRHDMSVSTPWNEARASDFVLMFHKDLEFSKLPRSRRSWNCLFSMLAFMECFPCTGQQLRPCQSGVSPRGPQAPQEMPVLQLWPKDKVNILFTCGSVIYVSKLKHKGYPTSCCFHRTGHRWSRMLRFAFYGCKKICYCRKQ